MTTTMKGKRGGVTRLFRPRRRSPGSRRRGSTSRSFAEVSLVLTDQIRVVFVSAVAVGDICSLACAIDSMINFVLALLIFSIEMYFLWVN
jgi:hypothetical protein